MDDRETRLIQKLQTGKALSVASLFHGAGVLDKALHHGFKASDVSSAVQVAVEIEKVYLDTSLRNNPELWNDQSIPIQSPIEQVDLGRHPPQVDLLVGGIPCTGASRSGRSKNGLAFAEAHAEAGALFFYFLQFVQTLNPAMVLIENVPEYQNTASMSVIRSVLQPLGYDLHERVFEGSTFGALEARKRLCVMAISQGLKGFDLDAIQPIKRKENSLQEVMEEVPLDSPCWKAFDYLAKKEVRDRASGKGFARQLLTGKEASCGTIGRGYAKCRSTEPFVVHPEQEGLSRIFTPLEHCRVKGIPETVVDGLSDTIAHEVLGQSVIYPVFQAIAKKLGEWLLACHQSKAA